MSEFQRRGLAIIDTHPVQYRVPVYRALQSRCGVPVTMIFGSDFSVTGYHDREFRSTFAWDTDLINDRDRYHFLSLVTDGGARRFEDVSARGLGTILDSLSPQAVLLTGYRTKFYLSAITQVLSRDYRILFRAETTDQAIPRGFMRRVVRHNVLRLLYRRFARLLPIGKLSCAHFRALGVPEQKLYFSPYCVDTSYFQCGEDARAMMRAAARKQMAINEQQTVLLFSGKLSSRKGPHVLVQAVKQMPEEVRKHICLCFLGDGAERDRLQAECAAPPAITAAFTGFKNQTELSPYYHAADLLVLPSIHSETWGLVVNEALHHGVPCVVSDAVGCAPDLIEEGLTGYVARAGSPSSLAGALVRSFPMTGDVRIRDGCRRAVSEYRVDKAAEGIARAFHSLPAV